MLYVHILHVLPSKDTTKNRETRWLSLCKYGLTARFTPLIFLYTVKNNFVRGLWKEYQHQNKVSYYKELIRCLTVTHELQGTMLELSEGDCAPSLEPIPLQHSKLISQQMKLSEINPM
jgi:dTDP-4-dehydrorhamnose reductase